jgi:hypothetical protein
MTTAQQDIPRALRVIVIMQLCCVFTFLVWEGVYAFSKSSLAKKAQIELFEYVLDPSQEEFREQLPRSEATLLKNKLANLQATPPESFLSKVGSTIHYYFFEVSPWFQAWTFFALISCFCFLYRIKGAPIAVWVLPLTMVGYIYFHHFTEKPKAHDSAFPSEAHLVKTYLEKPLGKSLGEQKKGLEKAWQFYLIDRWAHETPSHDLNLFEKQVAKGKFFFIVANLKKDFPDTIATFTSPLFAKAPLALVLLYLIWNLFFALFTQKQWKHLKKAKSRGQESYTE